MTENPLGISPLMSVAIMMHESFQSFIQAGFTEDQAIKLLVELSKGDNGREN